ncbi:hypothetical protein [Levilactobacillus spicheri]|uniref:ArpU family transcriptional regulator n=2 Tax=Levilactobacillus spicheri TaxID=216463 RepID=A0ABQ0WSV9_9LACO|nr:hypothetical protein [Levilactobacillus spicheri]KRL48963.1 hypothetical protein FD37_GL000976 [Levilactobacillus spicheri DSM 15429]GEO68086.1 hypothetical protein LSP04_25050 [Levilactobacillus spicheri]
MMAVGQTELFEEQNDKEIVKYVKRFFNRYFMRLVLKSGKSLASLQSPKYDGMPKAPGVSEDRDGKLVGQADCQIVVESALEAFHNCTSVANLVVWRSFVKHDLDVQIAMTLHLGHSQFARRKKSAMIEFYYAFTGRLESKGIVNDELDFTDYLRRKPDVSGTNLG